MSGPAEDEYVAAGPGLPGFVHRISGPAWILVGLAAILAAERLGASGALDPGHQWGLDDGFSLVSIGARVLLVLAPVVLLHRRPAAWSQDRRLAVAALVVAAGPVLEALTSFAGRQLTDWLISSDAFGAEPDLVQPAWVLLAAPSWVLALATPLVVVWGFDRLDDRAPVRFPRSRVVPVVGVVVLALAATFVGGVMLVSPDALAISGGWSAFVGVVVSLAISAAWTWAALASLASARARRGRWWILVLGSALLAELLPSALWSVGYVLSAASLGSGTWWDGTAVLWRLVGLSIAAGAVALAGAFASVPMARTDAPPVGESPRRASG
jgi:hypothetical protein